MKTFATKFRLVFLFFIITRLASGCLCGKFITGKVTYDFVPTLDAAHGGPKLDYASITAKPARRVTVELLDSSDTAIASTATDDNGEYSLPISGDYKKIRVTAEVLANAYLKDGLGTENCNGSSWNITVADNTVGNAVFAGVKDIKDKSNIDVHFTVDPAKADVNSRSAAPFAILDTLVTEMEKICEVTPDIHFPQLYVYWSPDNVPSTYLDISVGYIVTSHFGLSKDSSGKLYPSLYILGQKDVDTDEYDRHIIAHEYGHYVESQIFRADSIGGTHSSLDSLDPRVSFSEGFGNAISAMTLNNPSYVDTSGTGESGGFGFAINNAPTGDMTTIYSEFAVHYLLWSLYENTDGTTNSGTAAKILNVLNSTKTSDAFVTLQSFGAFYNAIYGATSENFQSLWISLGNDYNSLCAACVGSGDVADPLDSAGKLGAAYFVAASPVIHYPPGTVTTETAAFWQVYTLLSSGTPAIGAIIDLTAGSASSSQNIYPYNKKGAHELFVISGGTSATLTVTTSNCAGPSTAPIMMNIYNQNAIIASQTGTGCGGVS
ncbi:MAG: hypothetical protein OEV66_10950, partial [Spirochaetia bacterium]|nr:hypothetical protein [Spirochaetia bacterium]